MQNDDSLEPLDDGQEEEDLNLENEIMKLKLQAEFGAKFGEIEGNLPPELEQQFLKHVYNFEKAWEKQESIKVSQLIDGHVFAPFETLDKEEMEKAWAEVLEVYGNKNINVDFINEYPLEVKYRFATEELPMHETMFVNMPGMMLGFIYEEFHPNHAAEMEDRLTEFLDGWFDLDGAKCVAATSGEIVSDKGILSKEELLRKLNLVFDSFTHFEDAGFFVTTTSYDLEDLGEDNPLEGLGFVEGSIQWKAVMENGEGISFSGPFKFYFERRFGWWSIIYFVMPGWHW